MPLPLLQVENLAIEFVKSKDRIRALHGISFSVQSGEIVALVGESGSGKTITSLAILQLLPTPPAQYPSGRILFSENGNEAKDLLKMEIPQLSKLRGNKIAMIFQEPMTALNPVLSCGKQVSEVLKWHKKISSKDARAQTIHWFKKVQLPSPETLFDRYPHQLSGGQKQRVMIAMAMCCEPDLLICDEPTTALDVTVQKDILKLIKTLQQETKMGVIFITHDLGVVGEIADRAIVLYKGQIVEQNTISEIFTSPKHAYTQGLLACRPILHRKGNRLPVVADYLQGKIKKTPPEVEKVVNANTEKSILLDVQNVSLWYPAKKTFLGKTTSFTKAVNDVSFQVYSGETLGLVGESGCGKSTLGRTILQLIPATKGKIIYNGTNLSAIKESEMKGLRKYLQIVFQDPYSSLNPRVCIGEAIAEPLLVHGIFPTAKERKKRVFELLEKVELLPEHYYRYPHAFSGGQRQRIVIARALACNPSFIVCDESVSALDVSVQAQVLNLLNDLKRDMGFTIIFISHDLSVVRYISDRIMVMKNGEIVESGAADEIYNRPQNEYTAKLIASIPKGFIVKKYGEKTN